MTPGIRKAITAITTKDIYRIRTIRFGAVVALLVGLVVFLNAFYFHGPHSVRYKNPAYR